MATKVSGKEKSLNSKTIYDRLGNYFTKKKLVNVFLLLGSIFSIMSFNARISEAHDDSLYIEAAYRYVHEFPNYYYTSNAPLYPMFLALLTLIVGTNLVIFKIFSVIFFVLGAWVYYKAVDKKIPEILKYFTFIFLCINYLVIYYSSQTFSESFYLLIYATFLYYFLEYNFGTNQFKNDLKSDYKKWLMIGFLMMVLTIAKNIMILGVLAVLLFYLFKKEYRKAIFSMVSFGIFKVLYELVKTLIWGSSGIQYGSQTNILLNKDAYDPSQGREDIAGFITRFIDNIGLYVGKRFYQIIGFMDEDSTKVSYFLALIVLVLTFYGLYRAIKAKQDTVAFIVLFAGVISFGTFFVLHAKWDQTRFIMVHMPALLLGIFYGLYKFFEKDNSSQMIPVAFMLLIVFSMFGSTIKRGVNNIPVVTKNLSGDIYYGYTPDWRNYLELSAWCKDSLPENSLVACRKAPMSFVYAKGKHFYPIYSVIARDTVTKQSDPDSALAIFKKNHVSHFLIASLRINPNVNSGYVINTMHNIAEPIMRKYPYKFRLVKTMGYSEEARLYEIMY
ncbi:hypothetical protein [Aurantibacillus circumpalustris]|uniref:hypothetical protein n=1 Tax=Aurantibacillus circumpalustris TaxID=3036359 RepID=UPI00295B4310|nr:hypothetical protein [Aurantibacillus circumpalustris]